MKLLFKELPFLAENAPDNQIQIHIKSDEFEEFPQDDWDVRKEDQADIKVWD